MTGGLRDKQIDYTFKRQQLIKYKIGNQARGIRFCPG